MARSSIYPPSVQPGLPEEWTLPSTWQWTPIVQLVDVVERPAEIRNESEYQLVTAKRNRGGIVARERLLGKEILTKTQFVVEPGDFVISRRQIIHGACGVVPQSLHGAVVSNEYATLRVRSAIELDYLRLLSHTPYFQKTCFQSSMGVDVEKMVFKLDRWLGYRLPLPPAAEQRRIADIVATADDCVTAAEAVVAQLQQLKRGAVQQLLSRGMPRPHPHFKPTELGDLPDSWQVAAVGDVCTVVGGHAFPEEAQGLRTGEWPFIKVSDMNRPGNEHFIVSASNYLTAEGLQALRAKPYPMGTVVFPKVGAALLTNKRRVLSTPTVFDNNVMGLVPRTIDHRFLYLWSTTLDLAKFVQVGALPSVNQTTVSAIKLPLPPIGEQREIADAVESIDECIRLESQALDAAESIRHGLLADLLTGHVRVPA